MSENLDVVRPIHRGGGRTREDNHYCNDGVAEGQSEAQAYGRFKRTLFTRTKHSMRIFGAIHFIKLQNDS